MIHRSTVRRRPWTSPSTTARAAFELLLARPLDELAASPQVAATASAIAQRLEPEALREWVALDRAAQLRRGAGGQRRRGGGTDPGFHRAGIEIVQLEATTENAEDIRCAAN
ncbi:hypothetical protein P4204_12495 [Pseudomonas aeruginosa]|nr:hypothetical protein [Pseudomonas aeruginosa]